MLTNRNKYNLKEVIEYLILVILCLYICLLIWILI